MPSALKLSTRLYLGFGLCGLLAAILGGVAYWQMKAVSTGATRLASEYVPEVELTATLKDRTDALRLAGRSFATTGKEEYLQQVKQLKENVETELQQVKTFASQNNIETLAADLEKAEQAKLAYLSVLTEVTKLDAERRRSLDQADVAFDQLLEKLHAVESRDLRKVNKDRADDPAFKAAMREFDLIQSVQADSERVFVQVQRAVIRRDLPKLEDALKGFDIIQANIRELESIGSVDPGVSEVKTVAASYREGIAQLLETLKRTDVVVGQQCPATGQALSDISTDIIEQSLAATRDVSIDQQEMALAGEWIMGVGVSATIVLCVLVAWLISRSITVPVNRIASAINQGSQQTLAASHQVASASQSLAQGTSEQAASLEESGSSIHELTAAVNRTSNSSAQASQLSAQATRATETGTEAMSRMSGAIAEIEQASLQTAKIIKTIDEIAFQTNLLALNAAVEAARAGEAGKGFAVVAEEVRSLAMRSAEAAKNTSDLIETSVAKAKNGVTIAQTVESSLSEINSITGKVGSLITEIATASREQATGIEQINQAVGQMEKVTQSNAANAEQSAAASEELNAQSQQLQSCVRDLTIMVHGSSAAMPVGAAA